MFLTSLAILSTSVFIPPFYVNRPEEEPPAAQCAYQEKVNDWLWRCYTQEEYAIKLNNEMTTRMEEQAKSDAYWNSNELRTINIAWKSFAVVGFIVFVTLAVASGELFASFVFWCVVTLWLGILAMILIHIIFFFLW